MISKRLPTFTQRGPRCECCATRSEKKRRGTRTRPTVSPNCAAATGAARCSPGSSSLKQASETRSEEHTSELQSQSNLVCRLLLEKKKKETHPDTRGRTRTSR